MILYSHLDSHSLVTLFVLDTSTRRRDCFSAATFDVVNHATFDPLIVSTRTDLFLVASV